MLSLNMLDGELQGSKTFIFLVFFTDDANVAAFAGFDVVLELAFGATIFNFVLVDKLFLWVNPVTRPKFNSLKSL